MSCRGSNAGCQGGRPRAAGDLARGGAHGLSGRSVPARARTHIGPAYAAANRSTIGRQSVGRPAPDARMRAVPPCHRQRSERAGALGSGGWAGAGRMRRRRGRTRQAVDALHDGAASAPGDQCGTGDGTARARAAGVTESDGISHAGSPGVSRPVWRMQAPSPGLTSGTAVGRRRNRSQWRDRAGFSPASELGGRNSIAKVVKSRNHCRRPWRADTVASARHGGRSRPDWQPHRRRSAL